MQPWEEVIKDPVWGTLDPEKKKRNRDRYFQQMIAEEAPDMEPGRVALNKQRFDEYTASLDPSLTSRVELNAEGDPVTVQDYNSYMPEFLPQGVRDIGDAFVEGVKGSSAGIMFNRPENLEYGSRGEKIAHMAGEVAGDIPAMTVGALSGAGAGPAAPVVAAGGAFAVPEAIKYVARRAWDEGGIGQNVDAEETARQIVDRLAGGIGAAGKGYAIGAATGLAGKVAPHGAKTISELLAMTGTGSAVHQQIPTLDDVVNNAILLGGMKGATRAARGVREAAGRLKPDLDMAKLAPDQIDLGRQQDLFRPKWEAERNVIVQSAEIVPEAGRQNYRDMMLVTKGPKNFDSAPLFEMIEGKQDPALARYAIPEYGIDPNATVYQPVKHGNKTLPVLNYEVGALKASEGALMPRFLDSVLSRFRDGAKQKYADQMPNKYQQWMETPQRIFDRVPALKEALYKPWTYAEHNSTLERAATVKATRDMRRELKLGKKDMEKIGVFAIAAQDGGLRTLQESMPRTYSRHREMLNMVKDGYPADSVLSKEQKQMYDYYRDKYKEYYDRIQASRRLAGQREFPPVDNYFTFMRNVDLLMQEGIDPVRVRYKDKIDTAGQSKISPVESMETALVERIGSFEMPQVLHSHERGTGFKFSKKRQPGALQPLETNAEAIFSRYADNAIRHIHVSPVVSKARNLANKINLPDGKEYQLHDRNPQLWQFVTEWADTISGKPEPGMYGKMPPEVRNFLHTISRNVGMAQMVGNIGTMMKQPSSMVLSATELGNPKWIMAGFADNMNPKMRDFAMKNSRKLLGRTFDVYQYEPPGFMGTSMKMRNRLADIGFAPIKILDMEAARTTWLGAYRKATEKMKLDHRGAIEYADDVMTRTQASAALGDQSRMQRNAITRTISVFQTFGINQFGYILRDVLGKGNPNITTKEAIKKGLTFIAWGALANTIYQDVLGMDAPFPSLTGAIADSQKNKRPLPLEIAKEAMTAVPFVSGAKFGSTPLGAVGQVGADVFDKLARPERGKGVYDIVSALAGNPLYKVSKYVTDPELNVPIGKKHRDIDKILKQRRKQSASKSSMKLGKL